MGKGMTKAEMRVQDDEWIAACAETEPVGIARAALNAYGWIYERSIRSVAIKAGVSNDEARELLVRAAAL